MDDDSIDSWLNLVTDEDPRKIATKLVRDKLLTNWQAKFLLSGRSRLTLGSYILLCRINRDELGDRFEAIHRQLGRKVIIQIFPASIGTNDEQRTSVLKVMQALTELDHPQLVHVYDVDQEGDRYFLVNEFVDGHSLAEHPRGELSDASVAGIVQNLVSAIEHAHASEIVHGNIIQENVLIEADGNAKLQGLSTATVRGIVAGNSGDQSYQQDYKAISKLSLAVLKEVPPKRRGPGYDALIALTNKLATSTGDDIAAVKSQFDQWVSQFSSAAKESQAIDESTASDPAFDDASVSHAESTGMTPGSGHGSFESPLSATPTTVLKKKQKQTAEAPTASETSSEDAGSSRDGRGVFIGAVATAVLMLLGGAAYWFTRPATDDSSAAVVPTVAPTNRSPLDQAKPTSPKIAKSRDEKSADRSPAVEVGAAADGPGLLSADRPNNALDPEATRKKFEAMYAAQNESAPANESSKSKTSKRTKNSNRKLDTKTELNDTEEKPASADDVVTGGAGGGDAAGNIPEEPLLEETYRKSSPKQAFTPPPKKTVTKAPVTGNPFESFPETVDLPQTNVQDDFKIAPLVTNKRYLMGLRLLADPQISKSKLNFEIVRSEQDKQLWDVTLRRRKREEPTPVAQIQKTDTELKFRWLPAAAEMEDANYFRNCKLKLSVADDFAWLTLRQAIEVETFRFPEDKTFVKEDIELPWLPNPQALRIALMPFQVEKAEKVMFGPREIGRKAPAYIFFREKDDVRFFFIEVAADLRAKLKLQAEMLVLTPDGKPQSLKRPQKMADFAKMLELRKNEALLRNLEASNAKQPSGMTKTDFTKQKKEIAKLAELATLQATAAREYTDVVNSLMNRKIPFEVYFDMDGHRIALAQSTAEEIPLVGKPKEK